MAPPVRSRSRTRAAPPPEAELVFAGRAWVAGRLQPLEVGVDTTGRICAIGRNVPGGRRHDVGDRVLLPAATDVHVHFREPGPSGSAETLDSGTVGAALGGVGLVGEMPNTQPAVDSVERLEEKAALVRGRAAVDMLLYAAPPDPRSVARLARTAGAFKLYLSPTTGFDAAPSASELASLLQALARVDLPVAVHAEDPSRFGDETAAVDPASWDAARPAAAEESAVNGLLAAPERLRLHVAHVTNTRVASALRDRHLSFEATAHHLLLSSSDGPDARFKVNPPLRSERERAALWAEYLSDRVPLLASDHAPHLSSEKARPFALAPSGVPGVETTVPLMLARVAAGELALSTFLRTACDRPARLFGQPLGRLSVGHRANLLVIDFRARRRIRGEHLRSPSGWSPFERRLAVFPQEHWRDGEKIVDGGEYVGRPAGRVVRPEFAPGSGPIGPADE